MPTDLTTPLDNRRSDSVFALMPISRLILEETFSIDGFHFHPSGTLNVEALNIADLPTPEDLPETNGVRSAQGEELRKLCTALVEADPKEILERNATVWFETSNVPPRANHKQDIDLLAVLSQEAERALDQVRFDYCRFDLPATLPGTAGTWSGSETFCCAVLYDPRTKSSELIAGEAILHSVVSKGLGLELQSCQCGDVDSLPSSADGEVGGIAQHGLRLNSDVMNANTNTAKYLRAMTLLEFLASPFEFQTFKDSKKDIAVHVANSHGKYMELLQRFRQLSDLKDETTRKQLGYRTLLVHNGQFLEEVIPDERNRAALFRELQRYSGMVIEDLVQRKHSTWREIVEYRKDKRARLLQEAKT